LARASFAVTGTNNPNKQASVTWANNLDDLVQRGVPITPQDFGAVADGTTDDAPAFIAAIAYLKSIAVNEYGGSQKGSRKLFVPAGAYRLSQTLDITHTLIIEGDGSGTAGSAVTQLEWDDGVTGIRIQAHNTSGASSTGSGYSGFGSIIRGMALIGGYSATEGEYHGIHLRTRATIEDCLIAIWPGDGIYSTCSAGSGGATEGNSNGTMINRCRLQFCRSGIFCDGADVNAWSINGVDSTLNRRWGIHDDSFLGNTYIGCHTASNGWDGAASSIPTACTYSGERYAVIPGQEAGASTNAPSGTSADNTWWVHIGAGGTYSGSGAWVSGTTFRSGGAYRTDPAGNSYTAFIGCYSESDQNPSFIKGPAMVVGGIHAADIKPFSGATIPWLTTLFDGLWAKHDLYVGGTLFPNGIHDIEYVRAPEFRDTNGTKILGAQGAAIADATDAPSAITQLNLLLAAARTHGLIAT
jgi:hypothetical protein